MTMILIICAVLLITNITAFAMMGADKKKAKSGQWRIKEKTLFLVTGLFAGLGGTLGMLHFRHKTRHWYFKYGFPAMLVVQLVILFFVFRALL